MRTINAREVRENFDSLLNAVASGEEFVIIHCGKRVAHLTPAPTLADPVVFPDRSALRASLPAAEESVDTIIRATRDNERY